MCNWSLTYCRMDVWGKCHNWSSRWENVKMKQFLQWVTVSATYIGWGYIRTSARVAYSLVALRSDITSIATCLTCNGGSRTSLHYCLCTTESSCIRRQLCLQQHSCFKQLTHTHTHTHLWVLFLSQLGEDMKGDLQTEPLRVKTGPCIRKLHHAPRVMSVGPE